MTENKKNNTVKIASVGKKKEKCFMGSVAIILAICIAVTGCSGKNKSDRKDTSNAEKSSDVEESSNLINKVQVVLPNPTGPEAMVGMQTNIAIQYYIEARMYLEKLSMQDASEADPESFQKLVDDAVKAFENAEKISDSLSKSIDMWLVANDTRPQPEINVLQTAKNSKSASSSNPFVVQAHAAEKSPSELTAQEIVDAFDKAKNGQKIKELAELLGTDAKHAYAELKIAQATLEGADATKIAEQATTCIKVAKTLKTAGTVAGLVIAAAPVATGAVASMTAGEMLATGGGIIVGAVNSGLELTSTGATLYYGTDENKVTVMSDKIEDSKLMKGVNLVVGLAGVGYNIKNQINDMSKLMDQAKNADEYEKLLTSLTANNGKEASNLFGILSFGLGSIDTEEGTVLGINIEKSVNNMIVSIQDTKIGTSAEEQAAMKKILQDTGYTIEESEKAVKKCAEMMESGKLPEVTTQTVSDLPAEFVENKLKENEAIAPDSTVISLDEIIDNMETFMEVINKKTGPESNGSETNPGDNGSTENSYIWVEPYSYFGVNDIVELYKKLREVHPVQMELTPTSCLDNNYGGEKDFTNKETFVIDMSEGAQTVYQTSYKSGDEEFGQIYNVTYTFTGKPSDDGLYGDLMTLSTTGSICWRQSGDVNRIIDEPECSIHNLKVTRKNADKFGGKAFDPDNGTEYSIYFTINRICIPQE